MEPETHVAPEQGSVPASQTRPIEALLAACRSGQSAALNALLLRHEPWLRLHARLQMESRFRAKFDPSDIVQQTLIEAVRAFPGFRGRTGAEFAAWLRRLLTHALAHEIRRYRGTLKRDLAREVPLDRQLTQASQRLGDMLPAPGSTPSRQAARHEREAWLAELLLRLPEDHREVIMLRNLEGLSHEETARRMGRTPGAVRMLWVRALARLRTEARASGLE